SRAAASRPRRTVSIRSGGTASGTSVVASLDVGSWKSSARALAGVAMKMLPRGTPATRVPAASTSTRRFTPCGWRSASSPPRPAPERQPHDVGLLEPQVVHHVDRVEHEVLDVLDLVEPLGLPESRVDRQEHTAATRQPVVDRHPYI